MFNFFKNRKLKKQQKQLYAEQRVAALKTEINFIEAKAAGVSTNNYKESTADSQKRNSTCPKCQSKNVTDRITRQQSSLDGKISGYSWSALTFGEGSINGSIKGKSDTNEVNKCKDCEHEWKKHEMVYESNRDILQNKIRNVIMVLQLHYDANTCTFNALDVKEKYNSLDEKKAALITEAVTDWRIKVITEFWSGISIDAFRLLVIDKLASHWHDYYEKYYSEKVMLGLGFTNNNEPLELIIKKKKQNF